MIYINRRAAAMFEQIAEHVDFANKFVLDLGSGYGDLAMKAVDAGASKVLCLEKDTLAFQAMLIKVEGTKYGAYIEMVDVDFELFLPQTTIRPDIVICTSVLPYLNDPDTVLAWAAEYADTTILEIQYIGDGPPGDSFGIENDGVMKKYLRGFWRKKKQVRKIGETALDIRPAKRSIWLCRSVL